MDYKGRTYGGIYDLSIQMLAEFLGRSLGLVLGTGMGHQKSQLLMS